jgi:acetoin utilization protein AcuC
MDNTNPSASGDRLLVYSPLYRTFSYGADHPLRPTRLYLTHFLMGAYDLLGGSGIRVLQPKGAEEEELLRVHSIEYIEALKKANVGEHFPSAFNWGLGFGDNPIFPGVWDWSRLITGGTLLAMEEVAEGRSVVAFHTGGGFHHAHRSRAAGFCYLNDLAVAMARQIEQGHRILYLDIDAHHGDGVQETFYRSDRVLTISIHESPVYLFPGTGYVDELGEGEGQGYSVNVPLTRGSSDTIFIEAFDEVVPSLFKSFEPDLLVLQLGVDTMTSDPLAHQKYTTKSLSHTLTRVRELHRRGIMATGGGGYDMDTVARCWSLAWGILTDREMPDDLPDSYLKERSRYGATGAGQLTLRDPESEPSQDQTLAQKHLEETLKFLRGEGVI